jgi:hypothetical protein
MFRRRSGIFEQHPRHRVGLDGSLFGADSQPPVSGSGVLPQLKVDRLCSVVDGTADFDPEATSAGHFLSRRAAQELAGQHAKPTDGVPS